MNDTEAAHSDWPRRVAVEIVEHQWNHGILLTRIPDGAALFPECIPDGRYGHNQEDVPREVWEQPVGAIVHVMLNRDPDDPGWPVFTNWEWPSRSEATAVPPLPEQVAYDAIRAYCLARFPYNPEVYASAEARESRIDYDVRSYMPDPDRDEEYRDEKDEALYAVMQTVWAAAIKECQR